MLGASGGLGWLVHNAAMNYLIPRIYASATLIIVLGFLMNRFFRCLEESLFVWYESPSTVWRHERPQSASRLPGRYVLLSGTILLLLVLILGSVEVRKVNQEAESAGPGGSGHAGHFGTPLEEAGSGGL